MGWFKKTPPPAAGEVRSRSNGNFNAGKSLAFVSCGCGDAWDRYDSNGRWVNNCPTCGRLQP